jgi:hypothetical protein
VGGEPIDTVAHRSGAGITRRGRQCCAMPELFLQLSLLSELPGCPIAHSPMVAEAVKMAFFAIILAASLPLQVTAMAVTITALAVCVTDFAGTGAVMCGAIGALTMGPWCLAFFEVGRSRQLRVAAAGAAA